MEISGAVVALQNGPHGKSGDPARRHAEKGKKLAIEIAQTVKNAKVFRKKSPNATLLAVQNGLHGQNSVHAPHRVLLVPNHARGLAIMVNALEKRKK